MITPIALALTGFISWSLALLILIEGIRSGVVPTGKVAPNGFVPDNANLPPFMQRLARAAVTDGLTYVFLGAGLLLSASHLVSTSPPAVTARFVAFALQMVIGAYWSFRLLLG
jgi:hypothetical protein